MNQNILYEQRIILFSIYFVIFLFIMLTGLVVFILQYRKKKQQEILEKEMILQQHTQELLNNRLDIQQKTMEDIGRDLHDNIGQKLTLASIYTQQISHNNEYKNIEERIDGLANLLNETLQDIRAVSKNLTNANIDNNSIADLIKNECKKVIQTKKCQVEFVNNLQSEHLSINEKLVLLRITQEFIQNSLKYSKCDWINIQLDNKNEKIYLTLKDDGIGFDVSQFALNNKGIGLVNMRKRAEIIGATFNLESQIGKGTSLSIII